MNKKLLLKFFWSVVIALSAYYLYRAVRFRFYREGIGDTFWNKQFWYVFHLSTAIAPLVLGPFQFWKWFRTHHIKWHRLLGKIYLTGSLLGGMSALYLGITTGFEGSTLPLFLLSILWLFMTTSAWVTIRRGNIKGHRLFVKRSYVLAMVFVMLRIMNDIPYDFMFFYIKSPEMRDATLEWQSWVVPLLITECCISWWPELKSKKSALKNK